jgi:class 3 adenylate cyclase/CHASE2 domain-containing sensor protein
MGALYRRRAVTILLALLLAIAATLVVRPAVGKVPWLGSVELHLSPNRSVEPQRDIVLITVKPQTAEKLGLTRATSIVPRDIQGRLVGALSKAGARVIVLDFDYQEEGDGSKTQALVQAISDAAPTKIVLGLAPKTDAQVILPAEQSTAKATGQTLQLAPKTDFAACYAAPGILPQHVFLGSLMPWNPDKTIRGLIVQYGDGQSDQIYPHIAVCAALASAGITSNGEPIPFDEASFTFSPGPYRWHVGQDMEYRCRWTGNPHPFRRYEFSEALSLLNGPEARSFKDKVVVVGSDADLKEEFQTDSLGNLRGVDIVAQFINSLRAPADEQLGLASEGANLWWCVALSFVCALAAASLRPIWLLLGFGAAVGAAFALPWVLLFISAIRLEVLAPLLAALCASAGAASISGLESRRFDPVGGRVPGKPTEAAILFVDLKGSTKAISDMELDATRAMLRQVLEMLIGVIRDQGGRVERTMGDGALAMWFAPKPRPWSLKRPPDQHIQQCLQCIERLFAETENLDTRVRERFQRSADLTVGAEVGTIVGDVVQKSGHLEWSWFGMPIHLAARLQSKCGDLSLPVILGPALSERGRAWAKVWFVGSYDLKGIPGPTPVYSLESDKLKQVKDSSDSLLRTS